MKSIAGVLRGAVTVLDERGWTQDVMVAEDGRCCGEGSVRIAATGKPNGGQFPGQSGYELTDEALNVLDAVVGEPFFDWNDRDGRTVDEVKAALLAAAERVEAGA